MAGRYIRLPHYRYVYGSWLHAGTIFTFCFSTCIAFFKINRLRKKNYAFVGGCATHTCVCVLARVGGIAACQVTGRHNVWDAFG